MTAAAEKPKAKEKPPREPEFIMPRPKVGQDVRWFTNGDERKPARGYVEAVFERKIRLRVHGGGLGPVKTCWHITDPEVKAKPDAVQTHDGGAWDFTEEFYEDAKWRAEMETRISTLEANVEYAMEKLVAKMAEPEKKGR